MIRKQCLSLALVSALMLPATAVLAQDETVPAEPEAPQRPASPLDGDGTFSPQWSSAEFGQIAGMLTGTWKSDAPVAQFGSEDATSTMVTFAPVPLPDLSDAMYVEVSSEDNVHAPYYQAILQFWKRGSTVHLRTLEIKDETRQGVMTAMWMYPGLFPALSTDQLRGTLDMVFTPSGNGWSGKTTTAYPVNMRGAVEMTSEMRVEPGKLHIADRFFDTAGNVVSGPEPGSFVTYSKAEHPFTGEKVTDGVWRITMLDTDEGKGIEDRDRVAFHYWGYLHDSDNAGYLFDSSKNPGRRVLQYVVPGRLIDGWREAVYGMQQGEWHRLILRSDTAYGEQPAAGGVITPWSDLIFTIQPQFVQEPQIEPEPAAPGPQQDGAAEEAEAEQASGDE